MKKLWTQLLMFYLWWLMPICNYSRRLKQYTPKQNNWKVDLGLDLVWLAVVFLLEFLARY
jgi:hypothetical protein